MLKQTLTCKQILRATHACIWLCLLTNPRW